MSKVVEESIVRSEILDGLTQVDDSFQIDEFACDFNSVNRALSVSFTASNGSGESVEINEVWE